MTNAELAVLSLVAERPRHGYEIDQVIKERGMRDWTEVGFSSIYYLLKKLERDGQIEGRLEETQRGPARKVYHITEAGRAALIAWLSGPPPLDSPRSAPLIQVFFSAQLSDEELLAKFEGFAAIMRQILSQYDQVPEGIEIYRAEINSPREHFFWMLTLENGIRNMRANLEWAESVIERIRNGEVPAE